MNKPKTLMPKPRKQAYADEMHSHSGYAKFNHTHGVTIFFLFMAFVLILWVLIAGNKLEEKVTVCTSETVPGCAMAVTQLPSGFSPACIVYKNYTREVFGEGHVDYFCVKDYCVDICNKIVGVCGKTIESKQCINTWADCLSGCIETEQDTVKAMKLDCYVMPEVVNVTDMVCIQEALVRPVNIVTAIKAEGDLPMVGGDQR